MAFNLQLPDELDRDLSIAAACHRISKKALISAALSAAIAADPDVSAVIAADRKRRYDAAIELESVSA